MIFSAVEYDAGASLHLSMCQLIKHAWCTFKEGEASPSHFASRIQDVIQALIEDKMEEMRYAFAQAGDKVAINRLTTEGICIRFGADFHHCNLSIR
jgi:hypothetical protein